MEIDGDATPQNTAALQSALQGFPDLALDTEAGWVDERASGLDMVLNLFYVLLALSVIVSLFGMVNTLILSVFERTRELGMLRAVGMTRRQVRRMVRQESVITALIGAAVGLPLGMFLAALVSNALADEGIGFQVPWGQLVAFTIVALIAGVLAAIVPARRAAKLNVLRALQYENTQRSPVTAVPSPPDARDCDCQALTSPEIAHPLGALRPQRPCAQLYPIESPLRTPALSRMRGAPSPTEPSRGTPQCAADWRLPLRHSPPAPGNSTQLSAAQISRLTHGALPAACWRSALLFLLSPRSLLRVRLSCPV